MKSVVIGASGYIGARLLGAAAALGTTRGTSTRGSAALHAYDLAGPHAAAERVVSGSDVVFVAAAISSPDICARDPALARAVNVTGTVSLIDAAIAHGARVICFSSDTVYGETETAVDEEGACNPAGDYAAMKHEVERRFAGHPQVKFLRLSYVFSRGDKFTQYLARCATTDEMAQIFHPFFRAVVHLDDVVAAAITLAARWSEVPGQFVNVGGPQVLSRIEFAETLRAAALPGLRFTVTEPAADFFTSRPRVIRMRSAILPMLLGREPRKLAEAVTMEFHQAMDTQ